MDTSARERQLSRQKVSIPADNVIAKRKAIKFTGKNINQSIINSIVNSSTITLNYFRVQRNKTELTDIISYFENHDKEFMNKTISKCNDYHEALNLLVNRFCAIFNPEMDEKIVFKNDFVYNQENLVSKYNYDVYDFPLNPIFKNKKWETIHYFMMWVTDRYDGDFDNYNYYLEMDFNEMISMNIFGDASLEENKTVIESIIREYFVMVLITTINQDIYNTEIKKAETVFHQIMKNGKLPLIKLRNGSQRERYFAATQILNLCKQHKEPLNIHQCGMESDGSYFSIINFFAINPLYSSLDNYSQYESEKSEMIYSESENFILGPAKQITESKIVNIGSKEITNYYKEFNDHINHYLRNIQKDEKVSKLETIKPEEIHEITFKLQYHSFENHKTVRGAITQFIWESRDRIDYSKCPGIEKWIRDLVREGELLN